MTSDTHLGKGFFFDQKHPQSSKNNITLLRFYPRTKTVSSKELEKGAKKITVVRQNFFFKK